MVEQDPDYRPRRATAADGAEPTATPVPLTAADEDTPKPIFREEADGVDAATVRTPGGAARADQPADTGRTGRKLTFVQRRPRADDDEDEDDATTLLPRTSSGRRGAEVVDEDDDEPRRGLGGRTRLALIAGVIAAVVVVGIAIIYAVSGVSGTPGSTNDPSVSTGPSGPGSPSSTAVLGEAGLLSAEGADPIDAKRTWTVRGTVTGATADAPAVACLGGDPLEGAPTPEQKVSRTLASDGKTPPGALHVAQAYSNADEASQAFDVTARALGTCAVTGDYLYSGRVVTGAGDAAIGSLVLSGSGANPTGHTVLISRTGRVLDVVDAYQPKEPPNVNNVAKALASVVAAQCPTSGGTCADAVKVTDGPPPPGGDQPGFLSTGDLPPVGSTPAPWVATPVEPPAEDFTGSQCETVNWSTVAATDKSSRIYLLQDTPGFFGLNDIVVSTKDEAAAKKLVEKVRKDWTTCKERKLTATVPTPTKVTGVAAKNAPVAGYTAEVRQKAGDTTTRYRVGIASVGTKVAFTFLNPVKGLDLTTDQWNLVAVRAAQRATQTS